MGAIALRNYNRHEKMPVLFIGHGSPINIILKNDFTRALVKLGRELPTPEAIMVISAHWLLSKKRNSMQISIKVIL